MTLLHWLMNLGFAGGGTVSALPNPQMLFLGDVRLRGSEVTSPNYERTLTLATDSELQGE